MYHKVVCPYNSAYSTYYVPEVQPGTLNFYVLLDCQAVTIQTSRSSQKLFLHLYPLTYREKGGGGIERRCISGKKHVMALEPSNP